MEILVIGVGYVGLITGVCFAEMGHHVTCLDIDQEKIDSLKKGKVPFYEPGLNELVSKNSLAKRLDFTTNYKAAKTKKVIFIAVGTPPQDNGTANLSYVEEAACSIAANLMDYTLIVNKSTVPVGTTRRLKQIIHAFLKTKKTHPSFDLISCPEFLKEGSAIDDCMKPDRIIIGSDSEKATSILKRLYSSFTLNHNRILIMDIESAELTKYASNAMLATRISFMNELSGICEKVGADIHQVRLGMSSDHRIGHHFLYAGAGYGGSCFPKDIRALCTLAQKLGCETSLLEAVDAVNEKQKKFLPKRISDYFRNKGGIKGKNFAIWGLSFKPNTDDMREAPSLPLIAFLLKKGATLRLYDPAAIGNAKKMLKGQKQIRFCLNEYQAAQDTDGIILMTEWKQFRFVNLKTVLTKMRGTAFFDGRNQYVPKEMALKGFHYIGIGVRQTPQNLLNQLRVTHRKKELQYDSSRCEIDAAFID